jgi:hypothetical protein
MQNDCRVFCNTPDMKQHICIRRISGIIVVGLLLILLHQPVAALSPTDVSGPVNDAAMKLVQFCIEPRTGLDEQAAATLVDYVLSSKQSREHGLPKSLQATGAYYEFDTKVTFPRFMEYSYNPSIPSAVTRPSSLRYSIWATPSGEAQALPHTWKPVPPGGAPVVVHGMQRESDTPDLNTGVYHEYDLKRTLILLNHKGRQALVSVSKQISKSGVGEKGVILGNDHDWNYYYSGEPGSTITGLGWAKSYIYDYFSIGVYVESGAASAVVRTGAFQWLRAGWSGINFVKSNHILAGMKRFARDSRTILESPRLPAPNQMVSVYQRLSNLSAGDLIKKYAALHQAQRASAIQTGKIGGSKGEEPVSFANTPREEMVEVLMVEYLKLALGKPTQLGKQLEAFETR